MECGYPPAQASGGDVSPTPECLMTCAGGWAWQLVGEGPPQELRTDPSPGYNCLQEDPPTPMWSRKGEGETLRTPGFAEGTTPQKRGQNGPVIEGAYLWGRRKPRRERGGRRQDCPVPSRPGCSHGCGTNHRPAGRVCGRACGCVRVCTRANVCVHVCACVCECVHIKAGSWPSVSRIQSHGV